MISIKTLHNTSFEQIFKAFKNAFSDYVEPFDLTFDQLKYMTERRGCDLNLSFGAFNGEDLVGLTLNGIGKWNGKLTAYDTGTGIIKEFRKQGIATKMFNESLPVLRENKIDQYLLEVIKSNIAAVELYKKAGFKVTREFDYFSDESSKYKGRKYELPDGYEIREINNQDWKTFKSFWDFQPSWQNSIDSLTNKIEHLNILGAYNNKQLIGYGIIEKHTGDIPQLAIATEHRRKGIATCLFYKLASLIFNTEIRIINTSADHEPSRLFAKKLGFQLGIGQYEMMLPL